jgi:hypothetical protein
VLSLTLSLSLSQAFDLKEESILGNMREEKGGGEAEKKEF